MPPSAAPSGPRASSEPAAPSARHNSGPMRCSEAADTAQPMSAPPARARRTESARGSRRQASHSSVAVHSATVVAGDSRWLTGSSCRPPPPERWSGPERDARQRVDFAGPGAGDYNGAIRAAEAVVSGWLGRYRHIATGDLARVLQLLGER